MFKTNTAISSCVKKSCSNGEASWEPETASQTMRRDWFTATPYFCCEVDDEDDSPAAENLLSW
jgi:hypothetical protein